jgi:ABC-type multidrug transport system ATPase subunit
MKRRVSMAMSLTGNPRIIFLDEPSSGLDPVKRRHFWQLIQRVTTNKAVLLTTHLMEEADTLCNEIGIITTGKLRCIGNSLALKSAFTEGVKLQVVMNPENRTDEKIEDFLEVLKNKLKDVRVESSQYSE